MPTQASLSETVEPIRYRVDLGDHVQHLATVTVTVPASIAPGARIVLPTWTPGSYVIRDYAHWVQRVEANDAGGSVQVGIDGHTAWRLPDDVDGDVEFSFELYANQLTVRTNHVDDLHALLVAAATFPFVEGATDRPHEVVIEAPDDWTVWGLLPRHSGETSGDGSVDAEVFVADDYDHLVDSAFEAGAHDEVAFEVAGVPHRFVWAGHAGRPDLDRIAEDARVVCEQAVELLGDLPTRDYTFICGAWDQTGGGLEHRDGSVLMTPTTTFQDDDRYARFQSLVAHEYLHLWNVKRMTPAALVRPDYERPTHTTSLWVAEGWTAYYDQLLPVRSGLWSTKRYLEAMRDDLHGVLQTPGRQQQSVQEASHYAWTGLYRRDENSINLSPSYYRHGSVLAWCLDLLIRRNAPDGPGLDGALRLLWQRFGRSSETGGYTEDDVTAAVSEVAGTDLRDFFTEHVAGRTDPPIGGLLDVVGLQLRSDPKADRVPRLGVSTSEDDAGITIGAVLRGGPAWDAGITGGDRLVAIDGTRVDRGALDVTLKAWAPGDVVHVAHTRGPRLLVSAVRLGDPVVKHDLVAVSEPTAEQRAQFRDWTGQDLVTNGG